MTPAFSRALALHAPGERPRQFEQPSPEAVRRNRIRRSLTLDSWPHKIEAFRSLYCLDQHNLSAPAILSDDRKQLHFGLMDEEDREVHEAWGAGDVIGVFDGILDSIVVRLGLLAEMGFSPDLINEGMAEVHASNLTKTDDKGQPVINGVTCPLDPTYPAGKVLKGPSYIKADLRKVLANFLLTSADDCVTTDVPPMESSDGQR